MWRTDSLEKTLMLWKIDGRRRWGQWRKRWLDGITDSMQHEFEQVPGVSDGQRNLVWLQSMGLQRVGHVWATFTFMSVMLSSHSILFSYPQSFPASWAFPMSRLFTLGGQCVGASASASVLPMNIQDWFPLWLSGLISLLSKGLSRVFSNTVVQNINSSVLSFLYGPTLTSMHNYWKNHSFD